MRDRVLAPADAYHTMAAVLPDWYYLTPTPVEGVKLTVVGRDGVPTIWHMDTGLAAMVLPQLDQRHVRYSRSPYKERGW